MTCRPGGFRIRPALSTTAAVCLRPHGLAVSASRSTGAVARERLALADRARCDDPAVPRHGERADPVGAGAEVADHEAAVTERAVERTSTAVPSEPPGRRVESMVVDKP